MRSGYGGPLSGTTSDREVLGNPEDTGQVELGTVGWVGDAKEEDIFELGTGSNDGVTLVKVQLFRGRGDQDETEDNAKPGQARGTQILARAMGPNWYIPARGSQVIVARPAGFDGPGCWHILGVPGPNPATQVGGTSRGEPDVILDFGPKRRVIIKAHTVVLSDYNDRYFMVGPDGGIKAGDPDGSGYQLKSGTFIAYVAEGSPPTVKAQLGVTVAKGFMASHKDTKVSSIKLKDGQATIAGGGSIALEFANGKLGSGASPVAGVQYGPGFGVPSTSWFVQS